MARHDVYLDEMPHGEVRPWVALLLKIRFGARSADLVKNKRGKGGIYRNFSPQCTDDTKLICMKG